MSGRDARDLLASGLAHGWMRRPLPFGGRPQVARPDPE